MKNQENGRIKVNILMKSATPKCKLHSKPKCKLHSKPKCKLHAKLKCKLHAKPKCKLHVKPKCKFHAKPKCKLFSVISPLIEELYGEQKCFYFFLRFIFVKG